MFDAYTIPRDVIYMLSALDLSATQFKIILNVVINNQNNASREMSRSFLSDVTRTSKEYVSRALKDLLKRKILIEVIKPDPIHARVLAINTNVSEWIESMHGEIDET